ncbi:hypothetical protein ACTA71_007158 [Dictyostelium dimigraforme]
MKEKQVAIVGIGFRLPSGNNEKALNSPNELFGNLMNGYDGVRSSNERWSENYHLSGQVSNQNAGLLPLNEWKSFDPLFFGINPSEAPLLDPEQRLLLKCTWEALEDASIDPISIRGSKTSVFIGCSDSEYYKANFDINVTPKNVFSKSLFTIANRISYSFDFRGESISLDTACSSSLNAIYFGYNSIKNGLSNLSVVGGVSFLLSTESTRGYSHLNMLSKTHGKCKAFDESADGFVRSESVGVAILKNLDDAIKDGNTIYCVINGASSNADSNGYQDKLAFYSPSIQSQVNNINLAFDSTATTALKNSIGPNDIDYFEAHGTGTPTGDPIEAEAISKAFKERDKSTPLLIGSFKSNIGHCEASSGIASLIKCCSMFKHKYFVPNIHFNKPNPLIKFDEWNLKVVTKPIPFSSNNEKKKPISMMINNFGITGSNCCLILSEYNNKHTNNNNIYNNNIINNQHENQKLLIPISANSVKSLDRYQSLIIEYFNKSTNSDNNSFQNFIKNQIKSKSQSLVQRSVIIANNSNELLETLTNKKQIQTSNSKSSNMSIIKKNPITVFVFCGQGPQYNKMGLDLYNNQPIFKKSMDLLDGKLKEYYGYSILEKLRDIKDDDTITIHDPIIAQPSMCLFMVSLFELYKHWGVSPSFIIGHSFGEVPSAYCSGMIDLDTLCYLTYHRSVAQSKTNGCGKMLSISISSEDYIQNYSLKYPDIEIACYNSPTSIVIAGNVNSLNEISTDLKGKGIFSAMLGSLQSFHTSSQESTKDYILNLNINSKQSTIPTFSTLTTKLFNNNNELPTIFNSEYAYKNLIKPVKFTQTISNLYKHIQSNQLGSDIVFIEITPHPTLSFYLKQMIPNEEESQYFDNQSITVYSPLHKKKNDTQEFLQTISNLYCQNNYSINFKHQILNNNNNNKFELPIYQWDDQLFFTESSVHKQNTVEGPSIDSLGISNKLNSPLSKSFKSFIDIKKPTFEYLKGHMLKGKYYFPGCGYIDNIIKLYQDIDFVIDYIEFKAPFILIEESNQCLQTNVYQTSKTEHRAQFHYLDEKSNEWIHSSSSSFQIFNHGSDIPQNSNIKEIIQTQCNLTKLSKKELYQNIKTKTGLTYNGVFQGVSEFYLGDNCSMAVVSIETQSIFPFSNRNKSSFLNTPILDSCLHGIIGLINDQSQIIFDKLIGFKYYSSNIPNENNKYDENHIYVYSKLNSKIGDTYSGSAVVMLSNGLVLYEIEEVICKSLSQVKDPLQIEYPNEELYSPYLQELDSKIPNPSTFKSTIYQEHESNDISLIIPNQMYIFITTSFYNNIIKRPTDLNIEIINTLEIEELIKKYCKVKQHERLFRFVMESIKEFGILDSLDEFNQSNMIFYDLFKKSTAVISKLLFPLDDDSSTEDSPQSLFENGLLDQIYQAPQVKKMSQLVSNIIKKSIEGIVNERMVFRIIEFGGGTCSLTIQVIEAIISLFKEYPNHQIDIEYTWSDVSSSFIHDAKKKLNQLINDCCGNNGEGMNEFSGLNIVYKTLSIEEPLVNNQDLKPSYYDFVIMSNVLHVVKVLKPSIEFLQEIVKPNGQLLFIELAYKSFLNDSIFGSFEQWWSFTDTDIRKDRCSMPQESWYQLLSNCNFNDIVMTNEDSMSGSVIQVQKPSILSPLNELKNHQRQHQYDQIIIFGDNLNFIKSIQLEYSNSIDIIQISKIKEFYEMVDKSIISNKSIIYFIKSMNEINLDEFKSITLEYIQINQKLLEINCNCKNVLITCESSSNNYLASSIVGCARYFDEFKSKLQLYTLEFDKQSIEVNINNGNFIKMIELLTNANSNNYKELKIRNINKVYFERFKKETKLKDTFNSESFEHSNNLLCSLSENLEYQLDSKQSNLKNDQVEVKVLATGINYKDYLIYSGLSLDLQSNISGKPSFGMEFSGIITRISDNVKDYKVGDEVFGLANGSASSHVIADSYEIQPKPKNITHVEAASIPIVYITSFYSLFEVGDFNIKENESILIHSASGGVGLSTLAILKWKGHKSPIFVTVGSDEKKQYLIDQYGDFITGIYSTRDKSYVNQIKKKLIQLQVSNNKNENIGVDLIINTLSGDYIDSNFKCLSTKGRIVDLSITHLNRNEYLKNNHFKFNHGYHNVELNVAKKTKIKKCLSKITKGIKSGELQLIPITEFSNSSIRDAIEYINERQHIGKIVAKHDEDILGDLLSIQSKNSNFSILKSNYQINENNLGKNILVTGQSGIILGILKWIVKFSNNIENIIILSRSSLKWELELLINKTKLSKKNIKFHFKSVDVSNTELVDESINQILEENKEIENIDSIFHFAFIHNQCEVKEINMDHLDVAHGAKTMGAINLHNQSIKRNWKLINFVTSSTILAIIGSEDQCGYVSANLVLESLSSYRKSIGLPSTCIILGSVESTGIVSRNESVSSYLSNILGLDETSLNRVLGSIDLKIQNPNHFPTLLVSNLNFSILKTIKQASLALKFDYEINKSTNLKNSDKDLTSGGDGIGKTDDLFIKKISELVSIEESKINQSVKLSDYGADSLVMMQLKNWVDKEIFINIITIQQLQINSIGQSIKLISDSLKKRK